jgi:hypothetical protein
VIAPAPLASEQVGLGVALGKPPARVDFDALVRAVGNGGASPPHPNHHARRHGNPTNSHAPPASIAAIVYWSLAVSGVSEKCEREGGQEKCGSVQHLGKVARLVL